MRTPSIRLAALAVVAATAAAAACSSDKVGEAVLASPAVGAYTLQSVNSSKLPASVSTGSRVFTFVADTLRLAFGGTYTETVVAQTAPPGQAPTTTTTAQGGGQWADNGSTIVLTPAGSSSVTGGTSASFTGGNTLTLARNVVDSATSSVIATTQVFQK